MELCQSESLRDRLIKQTIPQSHVWSIIDQIIQGIEYIHSQKLIHRDLKPSNILFAFDNTIKIGDFGLVSAFGEDKIEKIDHTGNNELGGTILYMSPEQINRQSYNQKVDIYAIGIILFELLYSFSTQMERTRALTNIRLQTPIFPIDFACNQFNVRIKSLFYF
jgi:translation initiation factor 2-alpha kinase 3